MTTDEQAVAELDTRFQAAVKINDADTMAAILHDRFILVTGSGAVFDKETLLGDARARSTIYTLQDEEPGSQTVRVLDDTAVVTAKLRIAGASGERRFDKTVWFSDTYVRTPKGWQYFFGQSSLGLPDAP